MLSSSFKFNSYSSSSSSSSSSSIDWNIPCFDIYNSVNNIVGLTDFNFTLNLNAFHKFWTNANFHPEKIPCVRCPLLIKNFNAVALVYSSGSVIITGINDFNIIYHAFLIIAAFVKKTHPSYLIPHFNFKIHNVVSSFDSKHSINLDALSSIHPNFFFDPNQFPAAQFHTHDFINIHATVLIYFNGKIIVTGAKFIHLGIYTLIFLSYSLT